MMNRYFNMVCLIACLAAVFGVSQAARATTAIYTPVSVVASSELRPEIETINGDGLAFRGAGDDQQPRGPAQSITKTPTLLPMATFTEGCG